MIRLRPSAGLTAPWGGERSSSVAAMTIPQQYGPGHGGGWPGNELEETLAASLEVPNAGARLLEVLGRSSVWVPLPDGGGPASPNLDLPTVELNGAPYVPVFSSEEQFLHVVGSHMSFTVAPAREFARGLPPQVGIAVNPDGTVGVPLPPEAVAELCANTSGEQALGCRQAAPGCGSSSRTGRTSRSTSSAAAAGEFSQLPFVRTARRAWPASRATRPRSSSASSSTSSTTTIRQNVHDALGRALGRVPVKWPVQLVLLDAAQDPVVDWMRQCVRPFYTRG